MTLEIFSRDVVPIIQACFSLIGLSILGIVWWQVRQTAKWNKLQAEQAFIRHDTHEYENRVILAAAEHGVNLKARTTPITEEELEKIWSKDELYLAVMTLLNDAECTSAAINAGIVDWEVAFTVHSARLIQAFNVYKPMIEKLRSHHGDQELYVEMEKVVARAIDRDQGEAAKKLKKSGVRVRA